ncbi:MAG: DUF2846 domain-containing protein [Acidobacteria bacterium]|nr:DUF2846 domain-containing protein [Acidobacteriota bacterium]
MCKRLGLALLLVMSYSFVASPAGFSQEAKQKPKAEEVEEDEPKTESEKVRRKELELKACGTTKVKYSAKTDKKQHPVPEPPADKALVFVIRPTMWGNKIQTKLAVDGQWMGVNRGDNYFFFTLDPGEHHFCSDAENRSLLSLKVEAGKTYYLQQKVKVGLWKARNKLVALDEAEGKKGLAECHPSIFEVKK